MGARWERVRGEEVGKRLSPQEHGGVQRYRNALFSLLSLKPYVVQSRMGLDDRRTLSLIPGWLPGTN